MKKISIQFVINDKTIDIGQALIETDVPEVLGVIYFLLKYSYKWPNSAGGEII